MITVVSFITKLFYFVLSLIKSIWSATLTLAWGIAGMFLLGGIVKIPPPELSMIISLLINNWKWFFAVFFIIDIIVQFKELNKEEKNETI